MTGAMQSARQTIQPPTSYARFIVLSGPRTGSHMIAQALNSHSQIICFREVFNVRLDFVQFGVEGYDDFNPSDIELRKDDPLRFLDERIFCQHPHGIRAVGYKLHYSHHWDAPEMLERVTNDRDLHVIHLQRRNTLRALVSLKIAEKTGVWLQEGRGPVTRKRLAQALRHPVKAWSRIPAYFRRQQLGRTEEARPRVTITPDECFTHLVKTNIVTRNYEERFAAHPNYHAYYEDLAADLGGALTGVQEFLGVDHESLTVTMRRQNPQPLREIIENYDELFEAFKGSAYAELFND